jgi:hypothetical protein
LFVKDALPYLEALYLHANLVRKANLTRFQILKRLQILAWGVNDVDHFHTALLPELKVFDVFSNNLARFLVTCASDGKTSLFPSLSSLDVMKNKIDKIPENVCLPNLRYLNIGGNYWPVLYTGMFRAELFPRLEFLHLEYIGTKVDHIQSHAFANPSLRMISLMYNDIDFSREDEYHNDSFVGCPSLTALQISYNHFEDVTDQRFLRLFGHLSNMEALYIGGSSLQQITTATFARFPRLQNLELYSNKISEIPEGTFQNNPALARILLNQNKITTISLKTFSENVRSHVSWLDLSGNPFQCDCKLRWFSDWLRTNRSVFSRAWRTYDCSNMHGVRVESFHIVEQACIWNQTIFKGIIAGVTLVIIVILLVAYMFRYRWLFKLKLYEVFRGPSNVRRRLIQTGNFHFDVFVCYSARDKHWVVNHLLPALEGGLGLKVCICTCQSARLRAVEVEGGWGIR